MHSIEVTDTDHIYYPIVRALYETSFPVFEKRSHSQQDLAFNSAAYHLYVYMEQDNFIGFVSYWEFDSYIYIEHYAINQQLRGQGYGSIILQAFMSSHSKRIILEIDPLLDDISKARLGFYQKNNFSENSYAHIHPPYISGELGHALIILSTQGTLTQAECDRFQQDLVQVVMKGISFKK